MTRGKAGTAALQPHGTEARYNAGCREDRCRRAMVAARTRRRMVYLHGGRLSVDSTGTVRRIQALAAIGWPMSELDRMRGVVAGTTNNVVRGQRRFLQVAPARAYAALYDDLQAVTGPSDAARRHARRKGWAPPIAWDDDTIDDPEAAPQHEASGSDGVDEVAVQRALSGSPTELTRAERWVAIERLAEQGLSDAEIAERVLVTDRTVLRDRERLGIASTWAEHNQLSIAPSRRSA